MQADLQSMIDMINPSKGWLIGGVAMATIWLQAQVPQINLSWAELLYSVAAVIYAIAALIKSVRERKTEFQKSSSVGKSEDTIDVR